MGLCYSLRSRLAAARPSVPYGGRGEGDPPPVTAEHGDPQVRHRLRQDLVAKERADKKRSKSIDKTLKAEKREYKQTHRLLLLGEQRAGRGRRLPPGGEPGTGARHRPGGGGGWSGRWLHLEGEPAGVGGTPPQPWAVLGAVGGFPPFFEFGVIYLFIYLSVFPCAFVAWRRLAECWWLGRCRGSEVGCSPAGPCTCLCGGARGAAGGARGAWGDPDTRPSRAVH